MFRCLHIRLRLERRLEGYGHGPIEFLKVVSDIKEELDSLKGFLGDAEERQYDDEVVREWMSLIKDLVTEAHEITEKHRDRIARHRQIQPGFWNALIAFPKSLQDSVAIESEASRTKHLSNRISGMTSMMKAYGIEERRVEPTAVAVDPSTRNVKAKMVVGLEKDTKMIEDQLISTTETTVIGIYGVNGLGKTTLAKEVFNSNRVVDHFAAKTWAFVGQEDDQFPLRDVVQNMIRDLDETKTDLGELAENDLIEKIRRILIEKRCLVVLDDLHSAARWDLLKVVVSTTDSSSKLVVTACKPDVLTCVDSQIFLHQLRYLSSQEKWELFLNNTGSLEKGTRGFKTRRAWELLIQRCDGLPLTILVLAGLWKGRVRTPLECSVIRRRRGHQEGRNDHDQSTLELEVETVLRSSIRNLQLRRQPFLCLLEMTHYPVGREIPTEELFTNWIESEKGIFKRMKPSTARRYAQKCLDELVNLGLVQVVAKEGETIKYCQLHRVIRDFSIRVEKDPSRLCVPLGAAFKLGTGIPLDGLGFVSL